ncbi:MAG TPA: PqqD family protein [Methanosarcina sp.]|jgi:hypothetical protein|nr:PqqD family protein [Methanosarcina sp.]
MLKPVAKVDFKFRRFPKGVLFENGIALNETAYSIFELCNGQSSIYDIAIKLNEQYECSECSISEMITCVENTLKLLAEENLIMFQEL